MHAVCSLFFIGLTFGTTSMATENACAKLVARCKQAGYHHNGRKEKRGLIRDCFTPLLGGKPVRGVKATPAEVRACKASRLGS